MIELTPRLDETKADPLYIQLYDYIREEIQAGRIVAGTRLPSKRKLANHLRISLNTIDAAYQQLSAEGYIDALPRKGFFAREIDEGSIIPQTADQGLIGIKKPEKRIYRYDFSHSEIDLDHFPYSTWRRLMDECIRPEHKELLKIGDPQGEWELRCEISKYLYQSRGVKCLPDQIVIGAGSQNTMGLLGRLLCRTCVYAIEDPGYIRIRPVLESLGAEIKDIPLDKEGLTVSILEQTDVKITYVTPSHQFPTGTIMPIGRRLQLLNWSEEKEDRYIIEDDYDSEFRYKGKPIPALKSLESGENVIYMGTFSKALLPSLRMSYIVLPERLLNFYEQNKHHYKQAVSRIEQRAVQLFMERGHWEKHLNKMRNVYKKKQEALLSALEKCMEGQYEVIGENSGLHILLKVNNGMSEKELIESAKEQSVKVYPTSIYYSTAEPPESIVLLGFAGLSEKDIKAAIHLLAETWF
ncbi:PLP-dependent aminotransferase family protein [Scopulibacillus cellulosilyticus]|uniref:PLP-dependent aminotransferase family protein n=1 Tax=Scopulibacillus cellulosilyticus TaxID=2665665 RepID=A0ABW2PVH1_9BACL